MRNVLTHEQLTAAGNTHLESANKLENYANQTEDTLRVTRVWHGEKDNGGRLMQVIRTKL